MSGATDRGTRRFPAGVYAAGGEPDPRFSLANERTFLAWIRTSLALGAAGVALVALDLPIEPWLERVLALGLVLLGALAPLEGWWGWVRTERALREERPLPSALLSPVLAGGTGVVLGVLLVALVVSSL
ncbi:YidH family protein [Nocardioides bruguierae]|uniref:DUF202 domain-containing protein n=1 Tax=Nocardioides bruguierae TaxID=2945102 RepID=A0A9X2IFU6_9ACTN|nr:DUF202 domain-containing protein [Nocardioides bruguierae]MCM0621368.1 DUF202 domain-containing protein [Nocardioides bruguierae]